MLYNTKIYDAVFRSLFTFDCKMMSFKLFTTFAVKPFILLSKFSIKWDSRIIGGFLFMAFFYDDPNALELTRAASDGKSFLPSSCKYLITAFQHLCIGDDEASVTTEMSGLLV